MRHTDKALSQAGHRLTPEERQRIDAAAATLNAAIAGTSLPLLQAAIDAFAAATNPLATLVMNEVLRQSLGGAAADTLNPGSL